MKAFYISIYRTADGLFYELVIMAFFSIGSFQSAIDFYQTEVEASFGKLSVLRNRKQQLRWFLKKHKDVLTEDVIRNLRKLMDHLEKDIRQSKAPYRKKRHYPHEGFLYKYLPHCGWSVL